MIGAISSITFTITGTILKLLLTFKILPSRHDKVTIGAKLIFRCFPINNT